MMYTCITEVVVCDVYLYYRSGTGVGAVMEMILSMM